jgi:hypothetical protein
MMRRASPVTGRQVAMYANQWRVAAAGMMNGGVGIVIAGVFY